MPASHRMCKLSASRTPVASRPCRCAPATRSPDATSTTRPPAVATSPARIAVISISAPSRQMAEPIGQLASPYLASPLPAQTRAAGPAPAGPWSHSGGPVSVIPVAVRATASTTRDVVIPTPAGVGGFRLMPFVGCCGTFAPARKSTSAVTSAVRGMGVIRMTNANKATGLGRRHRWDPGVLIGLGSGIGTTIGILIASTTGTAIGIGIAFGATFGAAGGVILSAVLSSFRR